MKITRRDFVKTAGSATVASLLLGAAGRAYQRVKAFAEESDKLVYVDELRIQFSKYCRDHPNFPLLSLEEVLRVSPVSTECARFLRSRQVTFHPFGSTSPENQPALLVDRGKEGVAVYSKAVLCSPPYYAN